MTAAAVVACMKFIVPTVSVSVLLAHPNKYDGQGVGVKGVVEQIQLKTSDGGSDYEVFKICDKACVRVYAWGHPSLREGQSKWVRGTFVAVKHVESHNVYNEIEADHDSL